MSWRSKDRASDTDWAGEADKSRKLVARQVKEGGRPPQWAGAPGDWEAVGAELKKAREQRPGS